MIFNLTSGGGSVGPIVPIFSGAHNFVTSPSGKSGYIEIFESGTLAWTGAVTPAKVDITCVGAGGGGGTAVYCTMGDYNYYAVGPGGGGGKVISVFQVAPPEFMDVIIGAGGQAQASGGSTSVGELCAATGGTGGVVNMEYSSYYGMSYPASTTAGSGGNYGGIGTNHKGTWNSGLSENGTYATGGTNGAEFPALSDTKGNTVGTSQGAPTIDILGRIHAGGGAAGRYRSSNGTSESFSGGASDFIEGSGEAGGEARYRDGFSDSDRYAKGGKGGGGHGGGGGGGALATGGNNKSVTGAGAPGGNGFVIIGWGDYLSLYEGGAA